MSGFVSQEVEWGLRDSVFPAYNRGETSQLQLIPYASPTPQTAILLTRTASQPLLTPSSLAAFTRESQEGQHMLGEGESDLGEESRDYFPPRPGSRDSISAGGTLRINTSTSPQPHQSAMRGSRSTSALGLHTAGGVGYGTLASAPNMSPTAGAAQVGGFAWVSGWVVLRVVMVCGM